MIFMHTHHIPTKRPSNRNKIPDQHSKPHRGCFHKVLSKAPCRGSASLYEAAIGLIRIFISRSGCAVPPPHNSPKWCAGRSDGSPSNVVHSTNSTSKLAIKRPTVSVISIFARLRPGQIKLPPPVRLEFVSLTGWDGWRVRDNVMYRMGSMSPSGRPCRRRVCE